MDSANAEKPVQLHARHLDSSRGKSLSEVTEVPIGQIKVPGTLRTTGESLPHIDSLVEVCADLPPIVVHRQTMTVIDGVHRLRATERSGAAFISVVFFDGDEREAFVLAVKLNSSHGLPLSLADRKAAAVRILADFPDWSNRLLAEVTGLSDKTIAVLRRGSGAENPHPAAVRLGRDGVAYPAAVGEGRKRATAFLAANPEASAQEVALAADISLTTAKDVRRRARQAGGEPDDGSARGEESVVRGTVRSPRRGRQGEGDLSLAIQRLRADPSLRFTEAGRKLLRSLDVSAEQPDNWTTMANSLPIHCAPIIAEVARHHAKSWQLLAESLTERINCHDTAV